MGVGCAVGNRLGGDEGDDHGAAARLESMVSMRNRAERRVPVLPVQSERVSVHRDHGDL